MTNQEKPEAVSRTGHPTESSAQNQTDGLPIISLGKTQRALLVYLNSIKGTRFNVNIYSASIGNPSRSRVYEMLHVFHKNGLIEWTRTGDAAITTKGSSLIDIQSGMSGNVSSFVRGDRPAPVSLLSQHNNSFFVKIKDRNGFDNFDKIEVLRRLNALEYKPVKLPNRVDDIYYFADATIVIRTHEFSLNVHEVTPLDREEGYMDVILRASAYIEKMSHLMTLENTIYMPKTDFARRKSLFAQLLSKYDEKFKITLSNGMHFWIDHSPSGWDEQGWDMESDDLNTQKRMEKHVDDMARTDETVADLSYGIQDLQEKTSQLVQQKIFRPIVQDIDRFQATNEKHMLQLTKAQALTNHQIVALAEQVSSSLSGRCPESVREVSSRVDSSDDTPSYIG